MLALQLMQVPVFERSAAAIASPCVDVAPTVDAAALLAKSCDRVVEAASETTETDRVTAAPSGLVSWQQFVAPVRVRRSTGWVPVDVKLVIWPDGRIAPAASTVDMRFSRGGSEPLVTVTAAGGALSLSWPSPLPAPWLDGDTAVYTEVLPGVDLRVRATSIGFTHVLVVKDSLAAANPALRAIRYAWSGAGLSMRQRTDAEGLEIVDGSGRVVFTSAPATMWDSAPAVPSGRAAMMLLGNEGESLTEGASTPEAASDLASVAPVGVMASATEMVVTPDPALLDSNDLVFPLYIDPSFPATRQKFAYTNQNGQTNTDAYARSGMSPTAGHGIWRSFFHFQLGPTVSYRRIVSATVNAKLYQSHTCTMQPTGLWASSDIPTGVPNGGAASWSGMVLQQHLAEDYGRASSGAVCAGGSPDDLDMVFTGETLRAKVQDWVNLNWSYTSLALSGKRADGTFESNVNSWKRFTWADTSMTIVWNAAAPTVGSLSTTPATSCVTGAGRPRINTTTPTLKAVVDDEEASTVSATFEWSNVGGAVIGSGTVSGSDASTLSKVVPGGALVNGGNYSWRVKGSDGNWESDWSSPCEFTVDTAAPTAPSVTSTSHPSQTAWYAATTFSGMASASDPAGIAGYAVLVDGAATTSAGTTVTQAGTAISLASQPEGVRYVHVAAKDNVGNWSPTTHYQFQIDVTKPGAPPGLTSSTHPVDTNWYPTRAVNVSWSPPSDLSGIAQYAVIVDQSATTIPATTDSPQSGTAFSTTVAADGTWWVHVRAKDNAGNWSDIASHLKFNVDTEAPAAPEVSSSTHPDQNDAYASGSFSGSWTPPAGGAVGYSVVLDANPATDPGTTVTTTGTTHDATVADGVWFLHVRAKDAAGNWGTVAHFKFTVDTAAPVSPSISSTDFPTGQWTDKLNQEGIFALDPQSSTDVVIFRYRLDGGAWTDAPVTAGQSLNLSLIPITDGPHIVTVKSVDLAGNESAESVYTFMVGTGAGVVTGPVTGDITAAKTILRAAGHTSTNSVSYEWRRADTDTWTTIPAADVTFTSGGGAVTWPVATTGAGQYLAVNWDVAKTINDAEIGADPLDGPLQVRAVFAGSGWGPSPHQRITFDKNRAFAASAQVGPGTVNLITGNYTVSGADVSVGGLAVGRVHNTRQASTVDPMFGPGWVSSVMVAEGGSPWTKLEVFGSLVQVTLPDGNVLGFTATGDGNTFVPPTGSEGLTVTFQSVANTYTITDTTGNRVVFGRQAADPAGQYRPYTVTAAASPTSAAMSWERVTLGAVEVTRPTLVVAAAPSGVSCGTLARGCQALTFTYATTTTATASVWGDYTGRAKEISFTAWDPATSAMATVVMARYGYDDTGKLRAVWDPRLDWTDEVTHHVKTVYGYDGNGLLSTLTPPAQEPWQFSYTTVPTDSGNGRLHQVSRSALAAGTATSTVVYRVPTSGTEAPYNLAPAETARWGQDIAPTDATAVFPPSQIPNGNQASGVLPSSYEYADVSYLDANARQLNTAAPGGRITTVWYDALGNAVRELTAGNRQAALDAMPTDTPAQEAALAAERSSLSVFSPDGQRLVEELSPMHDVVLPTGAVTRARTRTGYIYDQGAPSTGGPFNLVTTQTTSARYWDGSAWVDTDTRTTAYEYDWTLKLPTKSIVDPAGLALTTRTGYDSQGRPILNTTPAGGASDTTPATRVTVYYSAAANSQNPDCGNRPEWHGLVCLTKTGGQPASGPELPVTTSSYAFYGLQATATETTSAGSLRTTIVTYDAAGRAVTTTVSAPGLGEPLQTRRNVYDQVSGQVVRTQTIDGSQTVTAEVIRGYDTLGRLTSYTDADASISTTTYDLLSRPLVINDGKATRTYTYDGGSERRGLPTAVVDSEIGLFTGSYDADGNLTTQTWPNGVTVTIALNEIGQAAGVAYVQPGCGQPDCTLFTEAVKTSAHGQAITNVSTLSSQTFGYDKASRLTAVADTVGGNCTTRHYAFDPATNRTGQTTYGPGGGGTCQTTTSSGATTWTYDTADRANTTGYTYDALGRTLTMPGASTAIPTGGDTTVTYHTNDMARSITQGTRTAIYTLDVVPNRFRSWTDNQTGSPATKTHHYIGDGDNPSWTDEGAGTWTRQIAGLAGIVATHTLTAGENYVIANLRGDLIATMPETGPGITFIAEYNEHGQPRDPGTAGNTRYGWLGLHQRAADSPGGIVLMGARLYTPGSGRFLTTDAVYGGSANPYEYCVGDGVNCTDTSGTYRILKKWKKFKCVLWQCAGSGMVTFLLTRGETQWVADSGDVVLFWIGVVSLVIGFFNPIAGVIIGVVAALTVGYAWTMAKIAGIMRRCLVGTIHVAKFPIIVLPRVDVFFGIMGCQG